MKFLLTLILVIAAFAGWLYFDTDARQRWLAGTPLEPAASVTTVYKWQDEHGSWQITDEPPPAGVEYEQLEYQSDTNVMPLVPKEELENGKD